MKKNYIISIYSNFDVEGENDEKCEEMANSKRQEVRKALEDIDVYVGDIEGESSKEYKNDKLQ